jgi:hypothetical protein
MSKTSSFRGLTVLILGLAVTSCATLSQLRNFVQPPRFERADGQPAEVRIVGVSRSQPIGGANVRLWMRVSNPNPFGVTISTLRTTLLLEDRRAATSDFPLGLPLGAAQESVVPLDLSIDFSDVPGLVGVIRSAATGEPVAYELEGTIGVDAGRLGQPTFGPMRLLHGEFGRSD